MCYFIIPDSQMTVRFALRPAVLELQAILGQVLRMTPLPNDPEHYKVKYTPYMCY